MARRKQRVDRHNRGERQINESDTHQSYEEVYAMQAGAALDLLLHSLGADTGSLIPKEDLQGLRGRDTDQGRETAPGEGTTTTAISATEVDRALSHLR